MNLVFLGIDIAVCAVIMVVFRLVFVQIEKKKTGIHIRFLKSVINFIIILIGVCVGMLAFEKTKDLSKVLVESSALIVAVVTFAAQHTLGNLISGFSISMTKPIDVDDKVKILNGGQVVAEGVVKDVTFRHTVLRTFDGHSIIIPNSVMDSSIILNTNYTEDVGNFLEFEVGYDSDFELAKEIIKNICLTYPLTLKEKQGAVTARGFTPNGVVLKTIVWTKTLDENFTACSDIRLLVVQEFREKGITIPYQTVTISNNE